MNNLNDYESVVTTYLLPSCAGTFEENFITEKHLEGKDKLCLSKV